MAAKGVSTMSEPLESADYYALIEHLEQDGKYHWPCSASSPARWAFVSAT